MDQRKELERLQAELDRLKAQLDEEDEKFVPKKGQLCWFWDYDDSKYIGEFHDMRDEDWHQDISGDYWQNCAPYIAKGTRQPWSGGECPVDEDALVVYEMQHGFGVRSARYVEWQRMGNRDDVIAYWELER